MSKLNQPILAVVEVMSGPMDGMEIKIRKQVTNIGRMERVGLCLDCGYKFPGGFECPNCRSSKIRTEENDIILHLDRFTSRIHAHITFEDGRFWLEDRGSTNGTWLVRGESVERVTERKILSDEDTFLIGQTYLRLKTKNLT